LQTQSNFRLLVVRLGAMGDILHALPAVTALRQAHPSWIIDWVVEPRWQALLSAETSQEQTPRLPSSPDVIPFQCGQNPAQPVVSHLHFAPTKAWRKAPFSNQTANEIKALRATLQAGHYNVVLDLQGAIRSAVVAHLAGCRRRIGEAEPRERAARWLFTERIVTHGAHVIQQDVELASAIAGDPLSAVAPWLPVDPAAEAWADTILPAAAVQPGSPRTGLHPRGGDQPTVLLSPGGGWGAKRWPAERYALVARELIKRGCRVLVNVGPGEQPLAEVIVKATGGAALPLTCSLAQLIALTRRVRLAIAGDTGPLHLACALGRPVVGIYGPTDPSRNGPFGTRFKVLRSPVSRRDHRRRDATEVGLLTIQPESVLRAARALLYPDTAS
jgi:heptosyltransferase-1